MELILKNSQTVTLDSLGEIVKGPSKGDLMLAVFEGKNSTGQHRPVHFVIELILAGWHPLNVKRKKHKLTFMVNGVCRGDGSAESWLIRGYISHVDGVEVTQGKDSGTNMELHYRSDHRIGTFDFNERL